MPHITLPLDDVTQQLLEQAAHASGQSPACRGFLMHSPSYSYTTKSLATMSLGEPSIYTA